jgi:hypothetical protein
MPQIDIKGIGTVRVSDDFAKLPPDQQQATVEEIAARIRARDIANEMSGKPDYANMSAVDVALTAAGNVGTSAKKFATDIVQPIIHPIDTAQNLYAIGKGILQKTGVVSGHEAEPVAEAVGKFFVERYGSAEAVKRTLATDPVGMAADVSMLLTGGGSAAARAPGLAGRLGEVAATAGRWSTPSTSQRPASRPAPMPATS